MRKGKPYISYFIKKHQDNMTEALRRIRACKKSRSPILDLGNCGLTDDNIPDELWELEWLEELNFGVFWNYNKKLKRWDLNSFQREHNQLTKVSKEIHNLSNLVWLNFHRNQIENLEFLSNLSWIFLSANQIQRIENLDNLRKLSLIELSANQVQKLENLDALANLKSLELGYNRILNYPNELFEGYDHNCLPDLRAWQAALIKGKIQNKSTKIILCGNSNVGKSCVLDALQGRIYQKNKDTTHAIEIEKVELDEVKVWAWDMGGQEVYHGTHRLFM